MPLCLTRRIGESVMYNGHEIQVVEIRGGKVLLKFDAPKDVRIVRSELIERDEAERKGDAA